ncbi:MAG: transcriptional repressor [Prevotella sp.]|nr:transcriptional repressor [Prevotella sp.]
MDETTCVRLLEEHGIKPTANRIVVVRELASSMLPQSLAELERRIATIDKSNVFRALTLFREHHLVHAIEGSSDGTKYELCHSHSHDHDDDQHPHFFCEVCQQTYCLEGMELPEITLPPGFELHAANYMLKGICPHCHRSE